jgi:DNA-binding IclR family transcriptional regulator
MTKKEARRAANGLNDTQLRILLEQEAFRENFGIDLTISQLMDRLDRRRATIRTYLSALKGMGLVEHWKRKRGYRITKRGRAVLREHNIKPIRFEKGGAGE